MKITVNETTSVLLDWLKAQDINPWLVGSSARQALDPSLSTGSIELLIESHLSTPRVDLSELPSDIDPNAVIIHSTGGDTLGDWLLKRGISVDAFVVGLDGTVVDPFGGVDDLRARQIRTTVPPDQVFREYPLSLFAVARVIATTDWIPSRTIQRMAYRDSGNILDTRPDALQWGQSINVVLLGPHLIGALKWLEKTRLLAFSMPEIAAMIGFHKSCSVHHKDLWDHTLIVTSRAQKSLVVRWAALCHDIGKTWTRTVDKEGKVHFFRHEDHGALLFESIAHRFALDSELTQRVSYVIRNHSRVNLYRDDWTDSAVRRLIRQTKGHLSELLAFSAADYTTKRKERIEEMKRLLSDIRSRIEQIALEDSKQAPLNKGIGLAIMECFHLQPSRTVGELKQLLEKTIDEGNLPERADDSVYLEWLIRDPQAVAQIEEAGGVVQL